MSSLRSAVASVIRLVGVGILLLGIVFLALAYVGGRQGESPFLQWVIGVGGFLTGIFLLGFSSTIARALTRDYE